MYNNDDLVNHNVLLNPDIFSLEKIVDPEQLAFDEAIRSDRILLFSILIEKIHMLTTDFACLFDSSSKLMSQSTIFQSCRDRSSWVEPVLSR